jgi:hypothetical protein
VQLICRDGDADIRAFQGSDPLTQNGYDGHAANAAEHMRLGSRRLGHDNASVTLTTYAHMLKPDDRAVAIMEKALAGTDEG